MSRLRPAGTGRTSRDGSLLWRFCGLSGVLHAVVIALLLLLAQPVAPPRLGRAVDVEILPRSAPGARGGGKPRAGPPKPRPPAPRVATRPPVRRKRPALPPVPKLKPKRPAAPKKAPVDRSAEWVGKQKEKPAPLPELQPEEARRQSEELAATLAPQEEELPPTEPAIPVESGPDEEGTGRGAGSAGEGIGADVIAVYSGGEITRAQLDDYLREELGGYTMADLEGPEELKLRFATGMLQRMVLDEVMLRDAEAKGVDQREGVKRALRRLAEDENIAELAERVGARLEVSDAEIAAYYEKHRGRFKDVSLAQVKELIRRLVLREKARAAFDAYIDKVKAQAAIERHFGLLEDPAADSEAALFTVNGKAYTVGEFRDELRRMTREERDRCADPKAREEAIESLVTRSLLLDAASTIADEGIRKRIEHLRRMLLISALYHEEVDRKVHVSDGEVAQRYEQVKQAWATLARARIAVVALPLGKSDAERGKAYETITRVRRAIAGGAGFVDAAEQVKADAPGIQAIEETAWIGELDHLEDLFRPCAFHTRVFRTLAVGELSEAFTYGGQLFVVRVLEREEPRTPRQEEIDPFLRAEVWSAKHEGAEQRYVGGLFDRADLKVRAEALAGMVRGEPPQGTTTPERAAAPGDQAATQRAGAPGDPAPARRTGTSDEPPDSSAQAQDANGSTRRNAKPRRDGHQGPP